jgi:hypothetical protein
MKVSPSASSARWVSSWNWEDLGVALMMIATNYGTVFRSRFAGINLRFVDNKFPDLLLALGERARLNGKHFRYVGTFRASGLCRRPT